MTANLRVCPCCLALSPRDCSFALGQASRCPHCGELVVMDPANDINARLSPLRLIPSEMERLSLMNAARIGRMDEGRVRMSERGGIIASLAALWHRWGRNPNTRLAGIGIALFVGPSIMFALLVGSVDLFAALSIQPSKWFERYAIIAFLCISVAAVVGTIVSPPVILFAIWRAGRDSRRHRRSPQVNPLARAPAQPADSNSPAT